MATRNLIVGCDGTWNDANGPATNVRKLIDGCSAKNQRTQYEEGVGTAHMEALPGGIYGKGLDRQILGGYRFLRKRLADTDWALEDNRVFIFGFSRGSYAARRLAGLINHSGIPKKRADVELGWQLYLNRDTASIAQLKAAGRFFDQSIEVLGVWDTVKTTTDPDFDDNKLPACVKHGYHAMAIDEKRKFFPVLKWTPNARVRQVWFAGVHADVGGGYPETGLSDIAMQWMVDSAWEHGLNVKPSAMNQLNGDPNGEQHDSFTGIWAPLGKKQRTVTPAGLVHRSVETRRNGPTGYDPGNLPVDPVYVDS